jgi:HK97 family phage prohead protease
MSTETEKTAGEALKASVEAQETQRRNFIVSVDKADGDEGSQGDVIRLPFILSTAAVDRPGDVISQDGWELENFRANPVVLWAHDSHAPPVGKASDIRVQRDEAGERLRATAEFTPPDMSEFGHMVGRMFEDGFLNAVSVGFRPLEWTFNEERGGFMPIDFIKQELLEFSAVPVPANPEALIAARSAGIDTAPLREWAEKVLDNEHGAGFWVARSTVEGVWQNVAERAIISAPSVIGSEESKQTPAVVTETQFNAEDIVAAVRAGMVKALK